MFLIVWGVHFQHPSLFMPTFSLPRQWEKMTLLLRYSQYLAQLLIGLYLETAMLLQCGLIIKILVLALANATAVGFGTPYSLPFSAQSRRLSKSRFHFHNFGLFHKIIALKSSDNFLRYHITNYLKIIIRKDVMTSYAMSWIQNKHFLN